LLLAAAAAAVDAVDRMDLAAVELVVFITIHRLLFQPGHMPLSLVQEVDLQPLQL